MIQKMARDFLDPKTRQATAFYAALGIAVYDVIRQGFKPLNMIFLAAAAGISVVGGLAILFGGDQSHKRG